MRKKKPKIKRALGANKGSGSRAIRQTDDGSTTSSSVPQCGKLGKSKNVTSQPLVMFRIVPVKDEWFEWAGDNPEAALGDAA